MTAADGGPWTRVMMTLLYVVLMLACLSVEAHAALRMLAKKALFVQEIQLIRLSWQRPLTLSDVWKLPERCSLNTIRQEFKYNVAEPMFLLRAVVRMMWRPMLPLFAIQFLMEIGDVAGAMVTGYLLRCFDSASEYPWYYGYGIALVLLVIKGVCMQQFHIRGLIEDEFSRVVSAIRLELFRLPLEPNGQRMLADISISGHMTGDLPRALTNLAQACIQTLGIWAKFAALYYTVGWLALIPAVSSLVIMATSWGFELLVGPSDQWSTSISTDDNRISEVYQGVKAIKLFGWER
ncbi:Transporter of the ATP-binding cassette (ABC), partial [Coemansia helicoidea]